MMQNQYTFCERLKKCKSNPNDTKLHLFMRFCIVSTFFTILIVMKFTGALSFSSPECINDAFFTLTAEMNEYLGERREVLDSLIIVTSLNIDVSMVCFSFLFVYYYRSWRMPFWAGMFYPFRSLVQTFFGMRIPSSYEWKYPGFPSIFVPYSEGDFFYSGHAGLMLALSLEFYKYKFYWVSFFVTICNIYNCIILVTTRSHYSIDIVGGLVFSHYFYLLAGFACKFIERFGIYEINKMPKTEDTEQLLENTSSNEIPSFRFERQAPNDDNINSSPVSYERRECYKLISSED